MLGKDFLAILSLTGKGFMQYGYLKNYGSALFEVSIKDNTYRTFSKAHIV
jgi:hypothetical protein